MMKDLRKRAMNRRPAAAEWIALAALLVLSECRGVGYLSHHRQTGRITKDLLAQQVSRVEVPIRAGIDRVQPYCSNSKGSMN